MKLPKCFCGDYEFTHRLTAIKFSWDDGHSFPTLFLLLLGFSIGCFSLFQLFPKYLFFLC